MTLVEMLIYLAPIGLIVAAFCVVVYRVMVKHGAHSRLQDSPGVVVCLVHRETVHGTA